MSPRKVQAIVVITIIVIVSILTVKMFRKTGDSVVSLDGNVRVTFMLRGDSPKEAFPYFSVSYKGTEIIPFSRLGLVLAGNDTVGVNCELLQLTKSRLPDRRDHIQAGIDYNALTAELVERGETPRYFRIVFRVFSRGFSFRYEFPVKDDNPVTVTGELTEITLVGDVKELQEESADSLNAKQYYISTDGLDIKIDSEPDSSYPELNLKPVNAELKYYIFDFNGQSSAPVRHTPWRYVTIR